VTETPTPQQLARYFWAAADILRDSVDSSDYKSYIFALLLLKRLSDRFDEEYEAIVDEGFDPEDRDKHQFFVPRRARWSRFTEATEGLGDLFHRALGALEGANPDMRICDPPGASMPAW